jgi:surface antigen-like variable number repeat protein
VPRLFSAVGVALCVLAPATLGAQDSPSPSQPPPTVRDIRITGAKELSPRHILDAISTQIGTPFTSTPDQVTSDVQQLYNKEGYTFARAKTEFDADSGVLTIAIDEGVIDAVEFDGVDSKLATTFMQEFALHAGDVFNRSRARQALDALLRPTRGAVTPGRVEHTAESVTDSRDLGQRRRTFDLIERNGQRILVVGLRERAGRFKLSPNFGDREDWFTPVDGLVPSLDFGAAVFDHEKFNHTFIFGHVSIKTASGNAGYAFGVERPFFSTRKLFIGVEGHDLTATDDHWQVSTNEEGLAAIGPRRSYRDYYRRQGVQFSSALRVEKHIELQLAWKMESHDALKTETDFSLWNDDTPFGPNRPADEGQLNALTIGASIDGRGFDRESLEASYLRHQLETPFGMRLVDPQEKGLWTVWRIDWTSEISAPDAFASDFDFRRHIVSGRVRSRVSRYQEVGARVIGGWSQGVLPVQRQFAIGGIGSVHGYDFKQSIGDTMRLFNLEYALGWQSGPHLLAFLDAGRTTSRIVAGVPPADSDWLKGFGWGIGLGGVRVDFGYKLASSTGPVQVQVRFGRTF